MNIGKTIRKYRKQKGLTQEEMALRLGVTAPAVNKWENENSYPDITLLAPIARLLGISLDELLSYQESPTKEEINALLLKAQTMLKETSYAEALKWSLGELKKYPNCEELILNLAVTFDAQRLIQKIPDSEDYDKILSSLYLRVLDSSDETLRYRAADALVGFFMRKEQYSRAEQYLEYFSWQNPEKKRKQAHIYEKTGRIQEACKIYEELLFTDYQRACLSFHSLYLLAIQENDFETARRLTEKQTELARLFEMGKYQELAPRLNLAAAQKNEAATLEAMEELLTLADTVYVPWNSWLYTHMDFKTEAPNLSEEFKKTLRKCFRDDEAFAFLRGNQRWLTLTSE